MLIVCPSCISTYRIPEAVRSGVSAMRCAECGAVFEPCNVVTTAFSPTQHPDLGTVTVLPIAPAGLLPGMRPLRVANPPAPPAARPRRGVFVVVGLALLLASSMAGVAQREAIVALWPQSVPLFAAIGLPATVPDLVLGGVASALADDGPARVLTLEGKITNERGTEAEVPNLRIVVRDDDRQSIYSWVAPAPRARLGAGESVDFSSRLVSPPANGHDLVVSFADRTEGEAETKVKGSR